MKTRINIATLEPAGYKAVLGLEKYIESTTLTRKHKDLIKIRSSQINRCSFCIDMHTNDVRKAGKTFYKNESFSTNAMRMGFASLKENEIVEALGILKKILS